jgi:hypothetical protein
MEDKSFGLLDHKQQTRTLGIRPLQTFDLKPQRHPPETKMHFNDGPFRP